MKKQDFPWHVFSVSRGRWVATLLLTLITDGVFYVTLYKIVTHYPARQTNALAILAVVTLLLVNIPILATIIEDVNIVFGADGISTREGRAKMFKEWKRTNQILLVLLWIIAPFGVIGFRVYWYFFPHKTASSE